MGDSSGCGCLGVPNKGQIWQLAQGPRILIAVGPALVMQGNPRWEGKR